MTIAAELLFRNLLRFLMIISVEKLFQKKNYRKSAYFIMTYEPLEYKSFACYEMDTLVHVFRMFFRSLE